MPLNVENTDWVELDLDMHRRLLFNTRTREYMNFEEQWAGLIEESEARRLFPRAFERTPPSDG